MKRTAICLAVSAIVASPFASAGHNGGISAAELDKASVADLKKYILALSHRIEEMEGKTEQVMAKSKSSADWAERIKWSGDFRYRFENIDNDARHDDRHRHRIRARIGLTAKVSDDVKVGVRLASGSEDPVSTNQTLGGAGSTKGINLDLAYIDWNFAQDLHLVGGKTKNPFYKPAKNGLIWDGDYNPEGAHVAYDNGELWAVAAYHFLNSEHKPKKKPATSGSDKDDTEMFGAQLGFRGKLSDDMKFKTGVSYFHIPTEGLTPILGAGENFGNSLDANGKHAIDYDMAEVFFELSTKLGGVPAKFFADYVKNTDSDAKEDRGFAIGTKLGKVKKAWDWEVGYTYQDLEADAVYGTLSDSDFGGGGTDVKGHKLSAGVGISKNTKLGLTYFDNEYGDFTKADELDYKRLQIDLKTKFK